MTSSKVFRRGRRKQEGDEKALPPLLFDVLIRLLGQNSGKAKGERGERKRGTSKSKTVKCFVRCEFHPASLAPENSFTLFYSVIYFSQAILWREDYVSHLEMGDKGRSPLDLEKASNYGFPPNIRLPAKIRGTNPCVRSNIFLVFFHVLGLPTQVMQSNTKLFSPPSPTLPLRYYHHSSYYYYSSSFKKDLRSTSRVCPKIKMRRKKPFQSAADFWS